MNTNAHFGFSERYHVYNRTNNKESLFKSDENRRYFLRLIKAKLSLVADVYAFALLGNHFHLLIEVKSEDEIIDRLLKIKTNKRSLTINRFLRADNKGAEINRLISIIFSGIFNSYSQAINKSYSRTGNLFSRPFKRAKVSSSAKFDFLFGYIHKNSQQHGRVYSFLDDPWHSYCSILEENCKVVNYKFVLDYFGGKEQFVNFHEHYDSLYLQKEQSYLQSNFDVELA